MKIKTRRYHIYYWFRVLFFIMRFVPLKAALRVAEIGGKLAFRLLPKYRNIAVGNLDDVFGKNVANEEITRNVFVNLAKNGAEWIKLMTSPNSLVKRLVTEAEGFDRLDAVLAKGKGVLVITGHFGNWELLTAYVRSRGYKGAVIGKRIYFHKYNEFIMKMRYKTGDRVIYRDESPKKILKVLRDGEVIGILADQDMDSLDGVFVDFFGKPAYTAVAPVKLSAASGANLLPAFLIRKADGTHRLIFDEPIDVPCGKISDDDVKKYTQMWTNALEKYVREYPDHWTWIHRRWKTKEGVTK
ncbi:MAG TPA: lysophospholipid acyltransferase family protein [Candidatus Omnitrophota bacterium]|nr:lysophospholipid acyltransferase family protein [Candidatus Omnitrophota bacterium]HPS19851.1 lysophospholipid acyltransferase family protein [Candidatus Omnitrophota bacterium]